MCGIVTYSDYDVRQEHVLLAKLASQAKRFMDVADHMEAVAMCSNKREMCFEERNMLSVAFANLIGSKRKELRSLGKFEARHSFKGRVSELKWCKQFKEKIQREYEEICERILRILEEGLLPTATSSDARVSFLKMKADYHRYSAEYKMESKKRQAAESSLIAYKNAQDLAERTLSPTSPMRLSLALNLSVFYHDILECPTFAIEVAQEAINNAKAGVADGEYDIENVKNAKLIIQLLKDNLRRWSKNSPRGTS